MSAVGESPLSSERLSFLYQVSQTFNASLDLDEVLNTVMDEVIKLTGAERGFLMLCNEENELDFQVARGIDKTTIEDPEFHISRSVVNQVADTGEALFTSDAQMDDALSQQKSVIDFKLRAILCAPITVKESVLGVVYVDNRITSGIFSQDDLDMLSAVAASAGVAIENARLYKVAVEKGRMEKELQVASRVQSSLIPTEVPDSEDWDFASLWIPAKEVAGDFFDFLVDDTGKLEVIIADVADKGMGAALFMAFSRSTLRASFRKAITPAEAINEANYLICNDSAYGMFITLVYAQFTPGSNEITYVNGGHNPPYLYRVADKTLTELHRTGMLVGVDEEAQYEQATVALETGDFIVFYTDGITEAIDTGYKEFGEARLKNLLMDCEEDSADEIKDKILTALEKFTKGMPKFDDTTLIVVKKV